jgi:glutamine amidotransferase
MAVAVVKLGVGNVASVAFALERLGERAEITDDPARIADAARVILPGVGAAAHASMALRARGLDEVLARFERPLLGICLGQQLLFDRSEEGDAICLGVLPGIVEALPPSLKFPAPHIGWSQLWSAAAHPILAGVDEGSYVYFVHSFVCPVDEHTIASAEYGRPFAAISARGNFIGCQFHPERSGAVGARILSNFLATPC